jgi:hypothetical protein
VSLEGMRGAMSGELEGRQAEIGEEEFEGRRTRPEGYGALPYMGVPPLPSCRQALAAPPRLIPPAPTPFPTPPPAPPSPPNGSNPYPPFPTAPAAEPEETHEKLAGVRIGLLTGENCAELVKLAPPLGRLAPLDVDDEGKGMGWADAG